MLKADTIFALSSPAGGAIAVLRASGAIAERVFLELTSLKEAKPRQLYYCSLKHENKVLDDAMAAYFRAPSSYTGEDMFELFCHGGPAVVLGVSEALSALGLRPAEPGEFTQRAFLNGKLDLAQAEAVMDLVKAQAEASKDAALEQLSGRLSREIHLVEALLTESLSSISAAIDYPEELEEDVLLELPGSLLEAQASLISLLELGRTGRVLREGFCAVLIGRPNSGKSSLLNALLGYERAIVTDEPGTTRDVLEESISIKGVPFRLFDTAGMRDPKDKAEYMGIEAMERALKSADAALLLLDGSEPLKDEDYALLEKTKGMERILLKTKSDLSPAWANEILSEAPILISAHTGLGLNALKEALFKLAGVTEGAYITNSRHISCLKDALFAVLEAQKSPLLDCASIDIRAALVALGKITGKNVDDEVLSRIFERFCVGK
ncbi:MAG TPA: tRNA uridine-5-carboxymethylaminomethyl(34) synthesis GTPase MnmE [Clostridia bacterium]|nr:tRNA uridine-5-carboxymethylaminomethyl(34) synthesis GTPase MnmE [Clostridia bacterium]